MLCVLWIFTYWWSTGIPIKECDFPAPPSIVLFRVKEFSIILGSNYPPWLFANPATSILFNYTSLNLDWIAAALGLSIGIKLLAPLSYACGLIDYLLCSWCCTISLGLGEFWLAICDKLVAAWYLWYCLTGVMLMFAIFIFITVT